MVYEAHEITGENLLNVKACSRTPRLALVPNSVLQRLHLRQGLDGPLHLIIRDVAGIRVVEGLELTGVLVIVGRLKLFLREVDTI